jgi:hypothetical protein
MYAGTLGPNNKLVIGLNPPFGANNSLAQQFVDHAAKFLPRIIVLIVPPTVRTPRQYTVVYEDDQAMKDR